MLAAGLVRNPLRLHAAESPDGDDVAPDESLEGESAYSEEAA
jgi:hypothetical protein